ncbi:6-phosphogluconate dehydrogenase C-terminal domain-like protein [Lojkania enalia]|uniref:6-phosphogluconate dehydrogenase C-terminal domain-like protein n=1 Tax=Lojkania enalia TaxID=147567 RepID=A0A9P4K954_9PLEO|nr:6-phosphogluconate dehydrogenase C-terminal domain-like protein [Didymosphaeria enalia]
MAAPFATVGIISIGQMGLGVAKLLVAHNYRVLTNVANRSAATQTRAHDARLGLVNSDAELVAECDYILSIVPPRDAVETARRMVDALCSSSPSPQRASTWPLYYLDLNAIAPSTVSSIAKMLSQNAPHVRFVDGGIIGGPPSQQANSTSWTRPGIPLSGSHPLHEAPVNGAHLAETLNSRYIGPKVGSASGLKCCFAALSKGMTALALQAFSTASALDVLPHLQTYLDEYNPKGGERAAKGIVGCPPKAYRWVEEMHQIGNCFAEDGGWSEQARIFRQIAGVYEGLASVVEKRGGVAGMGNVEGAIDALREGLEEDRAMMNDELERDDQ